MSAIDAEEFLAPEVIVDPISATVGSSVWIENKLFDIRVTNPMGSTPRLTVSRFYFGAEPLTAVDFFKNLKYGEHELAAKKAFFQQQGIRYILVKNVHDEEGIETALAKFEPEAAQAQAVKNAAKPLIGPRRRK